MDAQEPRHRRPAGIVPPLVDIGVAPGEHVDDFAHISGSNSVAGVNVARIEAEHVSDHEDNARFLCSLHHLEPFFAACSQGFLHKYMLAGGRGSQDRLQVGPIGGTNKNGIHLAEESLNASECLRPKLSSDFGRPLGIHIVHRGQFRLGELLEQAPIQAAHQTNSDYTRPNLVHGCFPSIDQGLADIFAL